MNPDPPPPGEEPGLADPERALAVAYAPAAARSSLAALFALDERLGGIVASTTEPTIGLMRLVWWRDSVERLSTQPAPAEPLLIALADPRIPHAILAEAEDGWAALLDGPADAEAIARHGRARGGALFRAASALLGSDDPRLEAAGTLWALADLAHRHSDAAVRAEARAQGQAQMPGLFDRCWAKPARPLAALALLARADLAAEARAQGSPRRIARMLALRLTGR